jgi:predicted transcriptional regulator
MKKEDFNYDMEKYSILFFNNFSEKDKRLYSGLLYMQLGYYGVRIVSETFNIHKHTVRKGKKELLSGDIVPPERIRRKGGGRKKK